MTNPENNVTTFAYDGLGRLVTQVADAGVGGIAQTTVYGYDRLGRQTSITGYADGATAQTTLYVHDRLGRVVWVMYPDIEYLHFGYNAGGKVIERTDQMDNKTTYSYDQMGRMEARRYYSVAGYYVHDPNDPGSNPLLDGTPLYANDPNVVETFSYDGMGRMLTATKTQEGSAVSNTEYDYSGLGPVELIEETHFGGTTQQIVCGYDQWGNLDELTYPDDSTITLTADARGRIATINRSATTLVSYNYVGGRVSRRMYPVGGSDDVVYDISYNNSGWATRHYTYQGATVIADFGYSHDDNGNIMQQTFAHRTSDPCQVYGYDDLDRLTSADYFAGYATGDEAFEYDKVGNRLEVQQGATTQEYTVDNLTNQYTAIDAQSISHDDAGNLTADHRGYTYSYDYESRLTKVQEGANVVAEFAYDALGRRIRKVDHVADVTSLYYYKDWQVLTEIADDGEHETSYDYVYGNYLDEVLLRTTDETTDVYLSHDHLYSPAALLDATGTVQERYEYDAYGKRSIYDSSFTPWGSSNYDLTVGFTGQRLDNIDEGDRPLGYYKERYYDTETGRFLSYDPLGYVIDSNLFQYCNSSPVMYSDPDGKNPIIIIIGIGIGLLLEGCGSSQSAGITWDDSCKCAKDINLIKQSVQNACKNVANTIKDKKLRECIEKSCKKGKIRCSSKTGKAGGNTDCALAPAIGTCRKIILYPNNYVNGQYGSLSVGEVAIHEFAHGCGWVHGQGKGVPGDSGFADNEI